MEILVNVVYLGNSKTFIISRVIDMIICLRGYESDIVVREYICLVV